MERRTAMLEVKRFWVTAGVSNRHVHLCTSHLESLFGEGYQLNRMKTLGHPSQYAAWEKVDLVGPKGAISSVRVLGPLRPQTQVEISRTDAFRLGVPIVVAESGKAAGSPGITIVGPKGEVQLPSGVIVPARHIHLPPEMAFSMGLREGMSVDVFVAGNRSLTFHQVVVRFFPDTNPELHIDTDEANAAGVSTGDALEVFFFPQGITDAVERIAQAEDVPESYLHGMLSKEMFQRFITHG